MYIGDLIQGKKYTYRYKEKNPEIVEYSRRAGDGKRVIVHTHGEPSMQDSFIIDPQWLEHYTPKFESLNEDEVFLLKEMIREIIKEEIENNLTLDEYRSIDYGRSSRSVELLFDKILLGSVWFEEKD